VAVNDTASTVRNTTVRIDVLDNDTDPDGDDLVLSAHDDATREGGTVGCTPTGVCTVAPPHNFIGADSFRYTVSDGSRSSTALVTVDVKLPPSPVVINEILPAPLTTDWDGDGTPGEMDEWIELISVAADPLDLGGWSLSAGGVVYVIPDGATLEPGAFLVLYRRTTAIPLGDAGGTLRLFDPDGAVADQVIFGALPPDASYSRDAAGLWHGDWPPTPGAPNLPVAPLAPRAMQSTNHRWRATSVPRGMSETIMPR
jgi:hypothetical protein